MNFDDYAMLGFRAYDDRKYRDAVKYFDKALELKPDNKKVLYYQGMSSYKIQEYEKAVEYYSKALRIDPWFKEAWKCKGDALLLIERFRDAVECYNKALEIDPFDEGLKEKKEGIEKIWNY